jgi:hypothetical protein
VADGWRLAAAATAAGAVALGAAAVTLAVVAGPGPGLTGYVSEAGVASSGYASTYRLGVFGLAAGLLLLAAALPTALRLASALLATAAGATALSGAVTCSDGCPLPPFEPATSADLVHGGASVAAVAAGVFAMLSIAVSGRAPQALRRVSAGAAVLALPLSAAVGLAMLALGRGAVVGVVERVLLAVVALWVIAAALTVAGRGWAFPR